MDRDGLSVGGGELRGLSGIELRGHVSSVNKVILVANLARDPEVRTFQSGGRVCNMTVATNERWTDKETGEKKERSEFHRVSIFNDKLVEVAEKYLKKGAKLYLEGQLETRKYTDQSGQEKYATEVVLRGFRGELVMLDTKDSTAAAPARYAGPVTPPRAGGSSRLLDDDIPFAPQVD